MIRADVTERLTGKLNKKDKDCKTVKRLAVLFLSQNALITGTVNTSVWQGCSVCGKMNLPSRGKEFFASYGKHNFTSFGKQIFT